MVSGLELNWREIAEHPPAEGSEPGEQAVLNIDVLVQQVRSRARRRAQRGISSTEMRRRLGLSEV